ncbi:MAG: sulfatase [Phycisphaerae bacterium]|nr:sulfatase [Phycisphaerae bacterium]
MTPCKFAKWYPFHMFGSTRSTSFPRQRALSVLLALIGVFVPCATALADQNEPSKRPNILLVVTDDESWLERSAYGWTSIRTPHFDKLASQGVLFTHAYASAPSCAPARAALLTGRNFWELEQGAFIQAWLPAKFPRVPEMLASAGYHTGHTGKGWGPGVILIDEDPENYVKSHMSAEPHGERGANPAGPCYNDIRLENPPPDFLPIDYVANFDAFLDERQPDQPFFFWAGIFEPHGPWDEGNHERLEEEYGYTNDDAPMPGFIPDTKRIRERRNDMMYEVVRADEDLGRLIEILDERGLRDNTIIIATSDQGTYIPRGKTSPYDWGVRSPLAIAWPDSVPGGRTIDDFVTHPDLAVTILDAAGLGDQARDAGMSGKSIKSMLISDDSGRVERSRDTVVTGLEWHGELPPYSLASRTIRDHRYAYVVRFGRPRGMSFLPSRARKPDDAFAESAEQLEVRELITAHPTHPNVRQFAELYCTPPMVEELYDLEADPWQMNNIIADPANADVRNRLAKQLHEYMLETDDPRATGDMEIFAGTRMFVIDRKRRNYQD